jgi:hypothetical protein
MGPVLARFDADSVMGRRIAGGGRDSKANNWVTRDNRDYRA